MKNLKLELAHFEQFKVSKPTNLTGGVSGTISGSRYYQGQSYIDIDWDTGTSTCDVPTTSDDGHGGLTQDNCLGSRVNW